MEADPPSGLGPDYDVDRALVRATVGERLFGTGGAPVRLGRFRILGRLGQGGMGVVYDAFDQERQQAVALKLLGAVDGRGIYQLKREFRALADVVHPGLVQLYELFYAQDIWFFTMERVDGVPFDQWVRADRARLRDALHQLAHAVQAIHDAGKLHCDLKPSNVLVAGDGRVVVLDFGLAGDRDGQMQALRSGLAGTPAFIAPEQAVGGEASAASDWYAVGVMLFEALTGQLPFPGSALQVLASKQRQDAPDARELAPGQPADLCALSAGLLHSDPAQRFGLQQVLACTRGTSQATPARASLPPHPARAPFVGREAELDALLRAVDSLGQGAPATLLLAGRSGMGKSALLDRFSERIEGRALLLRGRCHEAESVPYKAFDWVVDALSHYLRALPEAELFGLVPRHVHAMLQVFPVLGQVPAFATAASMRTGSADPRKLRNQCFAALQELLLCLTDRSPVVIVVDDLQWADLDSARLLEYLFGGAEPPPLLFVGAYRDDEASRSDFLRALPITLKAQTVSLGPLEAPRAAELVFELLGEGSAFAESIAADAEGVPFFIAQLAQWQRSEPARAQRAPSLEDVVLQRVSQLPLEAQRLLRVLSVAMGPLEPAVANEAAQLPAGERTTLNALRAERMVRTRATPDESVETYHDRIRETVVRNMSAQERSLVHAAIAAALERNQIDDPERLLLHHAGAGDRARAGRDALQAARMAVQKLAFNRAAVLFAQAIELLPEPEAVTEGLHAQLAAALADSGRGVQAAEAYLKAAQSLTGADARRMQRRAAQQYLRSGRTEEGRALVRSTLGQVGIGMPESARSRYLRMMAVHAVQRIRGFHLATRSRLLAPRAAERLEALSDVYPELLVTDPLTGAMLQTYCLREALAAGDVPRSQAALAYDTIGTSLLGGVYTQHAAFMLRSVRKLTEQLDTPYARAMAAFAEASCLIGSGRNFRDAAAPANTALELFGRCTGAFWERACVIFMLETTLEWRQELVEVARLGSELLSEATERDDRFGAMLHTTAASYAELMRDDAPAALALLERYRAWLPERYTTFRYLWLLRSIETLCYAGRPVEALDLVEQEWPLLKGSLLYQAQMARASASLFAARCAVAVYLQSDAPHVRARARRWLVPHAPAGTGFAAYATALRASLHVAEGQRRHAIAALHESIAGFKATQCGYQIYCERRLCELRGDPDGIASIDARLRAQGVLNPARWAANHLPAA